jgi:hypothetical protein
VVPCNRLNHILQSTVPANLFRGVCAAVIVDLAANTIRHFGTLEFLHIAILRFDRKFIVTAQNPYTADMKHFIVDSGGFVTTTGIYRMLGGSEHEITLVYGDAVQTFQGNKMKFRLI